MIAHDLGPHDYVVVISNDPKLDEPALAAALDGELTFTFRAPNAPQTSISGALPVKHDW